MSLPIITAGRNNEPADAVSVLEQGQADVVAMTRLRSPTPELADTMREGRLDDIRRCIGCHQVRIDRLFEMTSATWVHYPAAGYELQLRMGTLVQTRGPSQVVVVGAGRLASRRSRWPPVRAIASP